MSRSLGPVRHVNNNALFARVDPLISRAERYQNGTRFVRKSTGRLDMARWTALRANLTYPQVREIAAMADMLGLAYADLDALCACIKPDKKEDTDDTSNVDDEASAA